MSMSKDNIEHACSVVGSMLKHAPQPHEEHRLGVIQTAMAGLMHPGNFQEVAMFALVKATENNPMNCDYIGEREGVNIIFDAMSTHYDVRRVYQLGFTFLFAVAKRHPEWLAEI
jgi:hypothetical protein